jgi:ABC-2 type transport system permease protein
MAVHEQAYGQYEGGLTPEWSRFLVIPRYAYGSVFRSKLFVAFFAACFIYPLVASILIYLHHNTNALALLKIPLKDIIPIDASFFETFVVTQCMLGFFLNILIGPPQVSRDLSNNALPLYLCRPFSRVEYIVGKMSIVLLLLSLITWAPGLILFLFQSSLEGGGWFFQNLWIAGAIFLGSMVWILFNALLSQAISAWVKWRVVSSAALLGIFFIPSIFGELINQLFFTRWGHLFSLMDLFRNIWGRLFRDPQYINGHITMVTNTGRVVTLPADIPLWVSWMVILAVCAFCLLLLSRRVKAYEVVSS